MIDEAPDAGLVRSLDRALALLDALAAAPSGLGLVDLSRRVGIAKSTAHRLISTLEHRGFVVRRPDDGRYLPGLKLLASPETASWLHGALEELARHSGESVNLGVLHGVDVVYIDRVESQHALRWGLKIGSHVPAYCSAMGKAILAELPLHIQGPLLDTMTLRPLTPHSITDRAALEEELSRVHANGYAFDDEEYMEGVRCIAAPVRRGGAVTGAVSIAGPTVRFARAAALAQLPALLRTAWVLAGFPDAPLTTATN
jgi:DNA-binding IclR family transcriptional regulator